MSKSGHLFSSVFLVCAFFIMFDFLQACFSIEFKGVVIASFGYLGGGLPPPPPETTPLIIAMIKLLFCSNSFSNLFSVSEYHFSK